MLTDFRKFYDKKMCRRNILQLSFLLILATVASYGRKETAVNFANVCDAENQSEVQINGFLHPQITTNLNSNSLLLVENKNGTGGFIKVEFENAEMNQLKSEVKITSVTADSVSSEVNLTEGD